MIPVSVRLDDIDFEALFELARSRLPAEASVWTDYNFHDPGITLIDLAAYIADTQIYSLARHRRDERIAIARLLGVEPRAAVPAQGTIYPSAPVEDTRRIERGTRLSPIRAAGPRLSVMADVDLLPIEVVSVVTELPSGTIDHSDANERPYASYAPFGTPTDRAAALRITLRDRPGTNGTRDIPKFHLSLGFTLEFDSVYDPGLGGIAVFLRNGQREIPLTLGKDSDTTDMLQRSGAMILTPGADWDPAENVHQIVLRPTGAGALLPRLIKIAPNAVPVEQQLAVTYDGFSFGTGRPGQMLTLTAADLLDVEDRQDGAVWRLCDAEPPVIQIGAETWTSGEFEAAGPDDKLYMLAEEGDGARITVRFGNGINGSVIPVGEPLHFSARMSRGATGNIMSSLNWMLERHRLGFTNHGPIQGGADPLTPKDMLDAARTRLRENRPLVTSGDIAAAARKLPDAYAVERADVVEGWERGRRAPASSRTRTLVVSRKGIGGARTESPAWLRSVRRRLAPRLDLGERLLVVAPHYREMALKATVATITGERPETVKTEIEKGLRNRLTPGGELGASWPLGREVSIATIRGWIRRVPGVLRVEQLAVSEGGREITGNALVLNTGELPHLVDIDVTARAAGARR